MKIKHNILVMLLAAAGFTALQTGTESGITEVFSISRVQAAGTSAPQQDSLVKTLTNTLGVTTPQAEGGAGSLLQLAQENLSKADFLSITSAIPDASTLLKAAPAVAASGSDSLPGMDSLKMLGGISKLTSQFKKLGLDSSMISRYTDVMVDYLQKYQGSEVSRLLDTALSSDLTGSAGALMDAFK